ncbi:MAG: aspartate ammonia-lyase, partial [Oscillospiraceae bacterium]|nr:aspartate ammonia-lyase [Oscillospiraceae bacterium]
NQVCFNIMGNDLTITMAAEAGQMELNAFEPIIFWNLTHAVEFLTYAVNTLVDNCIVGITANRDRCKSLVDNSVGIITALTPHIGYERAAVIAKEAIRTGASVRDLILEKGILDEETMEKILDPYSMTQPGISAKELLTHTGNSHIEHFRL